TSPQNPCYGFHNKSVPHITLRSIAQNRGLDPILAKHKSILSAALLHLNDTLASLGGKASALQDQLVTKLEGKVAADGARSITDADLRRWLLPGTRISLLNFGTPSQRRKWISAIPSDNGWKNWEVPFNSDPDWPQPLQDALGEYREAWRAKMN